LPNGDGGLQICIAARIQSNWRMNRQWCVVSGDGSLHVIQNEKRLGLNVE
jgi:hypothetical protein